MALIPQLLFPRGYFLGVASRIDVYAGDVAGDRVELWIAELKQHPGDFA